MANNSLSNNIQSLMQLAQDMQKELQTIPYGAVEQQRKAEKIIQEIQHALHQKNEWLVLQIFEASIAPKMIKLAKEISQYHMLLQLQQRQQKPVTIPDAITNFAYDAYQSGTQTPNYDELDTESQAKIDDIFSKLYNKLLEDEETPK